MMMNIIPSKIYQVDSNRRVLNKPTELQQLEVLEKRGGLASEAKRKLWIHRTGFQGEQTFYDFMFRMAKSHWRILHRTWLNIKGRVECDFIVITRVGIYFFEIKNYNGNLVYEYNQQTVNYRTISGDIMGQFKNMQERTIDMCRQMNYSGGVFHQLVYINPYYQATLPHEWLKSLLHYNQLTDYIEQMIREEATLLPANFSPDEAVDSIESSFACTEPYPPNVLSPEELKQLKHGIACSHCGSFHTICTRYKLICVHCRQNEPKEREALRLIGDYSVLTPFNPLQAADIVKIAGESFRRDYINKILRRYYQLAKVEKTGQYINPSQNFEHTYPHLSFKLKNSRTPLQ